MYDLYLSLCKHIMCPITRLHRLQSLTPQAAFDLKNGTTRWNEISKVKREDWISHAADWTGHSRKQKQTAGSEEFLKLEIIWSKFWNISDPSVHLWHVPHVNWSHVVDQFFSEVSQFDRRFFPENMTQTKYHKKQHLHQTKGSPSNWPFRGWPKKDPQRRDRQTLNLGRLGAGIVAQGIGNR